MASGFLIENARLTHCMQVTAHTKDARRSLSFITFTIMKNAASNATAAASQPASREAVIVCRMISAATGRRLKVEKARLKESSPTFHRGRARSGVRVDEPPQAGFPSAPCRPQEFPVQSSSESCRAGSETANYRTMRP